ncbi:MAG: tetratricopeptide repeat protein, partial [Smithella sp.]
MQKKQTYPAVIVILVFISLYGCSHLPAVPVSSSSKTSTDATYHYSLGVLLRLNGKIEEATEELKQAVAADPGSSYLTTELVSLYTEQGDIGQAISLGEEM